MKYSEDELKSYYDTLPEVYGWDALCRMSIPKELARKTALDLACRRGKGVYKLAEQVGKRGQAIGVEWRADMLDAARAGEARAVEKCGFEQSNMRFVEVFPELLSEAVEEGCAHFVYVNCILNLLCDPVEALSQIRRVLAPGGLLVCDTVLAITPRTSSVVAEARKLGNAVQAAPHRKDFMSWLAAAGFDVTSIGAFAGEKVDPASNADGRPTVPLADGDKSASFVATSIHIYAPDDIDRHSRKLTKDISQFR